MPHLGAFVPSNYFAFIYVPVYSEVATEPLIGLTHEDYPEYYDYLSITFSKVKQKPRVVEEHDSMAGILSSVEAGAGVDFGARLPDCAAAVAAQPSAKIMAMLKAKARGRGEPSDILHSLQVP